MPFPYFPDKFRQFDYGYGSSQNMKRYHSPVPPSYNISAITTKVALFYGTNDMLTIQQDVKLLYSQLPNPIGIFKLDSFAHIDFLYGKDLRSKLNLRLLDIMESENRVYDHQIQ
ncbi:hypothetical protein WDU94_010135 [Cyamophila willieti]